MLLGVLVCLLCAVACGVPRYSVQADADTTEAAEALMNEFEAQLGCDLFRGGDKPLPVSMVDTYPKTPDGEDRAAVFDGDNIFIVRKTEHYSVTTLLAHEMAHAVGVQHMTWGIMQSHYAGEYSAGGAVHFVIEAMTIQGIHPCPVDKNH